MTNEIYGQPGKVDLAQCVYASKQAGKQDMSSKKVEVNMRPTAN